MTESMVISPLDRPRSNDCTPSAVRQARPTDISASPAMTDHRINLTLYKLDEIMQGSLGHVVDPLMHEYQAEQLANLADDNQAMA